MLTGINRQEAIDFQASHSFSAYNQLKRIFKSNLCVVDLIKKLKVIGVNIGIYTYFPMNITKHELVQSFISKGFLPRYATTIINKNNVHILLIMQMHESVHELLNTLLHEAIHATGQMLKRFEEQPENMSSEAYRLEEITAFYGSVLLSEKLGIICDETRQKNLFELKIFISSIKNSEKIALAKRQAERAVDFLATPAT